jgi:Rrf2 family nitric oxide-sensitive transcriptional repressor
MRLSTFTDDSLRGLIYLAARPGRRATIGGIATAFGISENHLTKVVPGLGRSGWIATVRGRGGGLGLAVPAASIRVGDVVRRTEGDAQPADCFSPDRPGCVIAPVCRLRGVLAEAVEAFCAVLDRHTLADPTRDGGALARVLFAERAAPARDAA